MSYNITKEMYFFKIDKFVACTNLVNSVFCLFIALLSNTSCSGNVTKKCDIIDTYTFVCHDVIPRTIPPRIWNVELRDFTTDLVVNRTQLSGSGWNEIRNLTVENIDTERYSIFGPGCFSNLKKLTEIHVHATHNHFGDGLFAPLTNLRILDLSNCTNISNDELMSNFYSSTSLPDLEKIILYKAASAAHRGLFLSSDFFRALSDRPVTYIDMSYAAIADVNTTAFNDICTRLITLLMRGTLINHSFGDDLLTKTCGKLKTLDISYIRGPTNEYCFLPPVKDYTNLTIDMHAYCKPLSRLQTIHASHLCDVTQIPKLFRNITGIHIKESEEDCNWDYLYINHNFLHYLDIEIICNATQPPVFHTKGLHMKSNGLKIVRPSFLYCLFGNVEDLDMSDNELYIMHVQSPSLFKSLFSSLTMLRTVNLSKNGFNDMKSLHFANNTKLERIDLSRNSFSAIEVAFNNLQYLRYFDVSSNNIAQLNHVTIKALNTLIINGAEINMTINIAGNPLNCFDCNHFVSIQWIFENSGHLAAYEETKCWNEKRVRVSITEEIVNDLNELCQRPIRVRNIVIGVSVSVTITLTLIIVMGFYRRIKKQRAKRLNRNTLLAHLRENLDGYEFLVFLSYSSNDEEFVGNQILSPLQDTLCQTTGIQRPLVCTGDTYFRIGRPIHNEMVNCLRRSVVVLIILSDEFLLSHFCQLEFQQAFQLGKPVLLMMKGKVNTDLMSPAMSELYRNFVRVHWTDVDGDLELKCSWEHVADCIISVGSEGRLWQQ